MWEETYPIHPRPWITNNKSLLFCFVITPLFACIFYSVLKLLLAQRFASTYTLPCHYFIQHTIMLASPSVGYKTLEMESGTG